MTHEPNDAPDTGMEVFFDAARADAAVPSGALLARIEAEALAVQTARPAVPRASVWRGLVRALGGWPAMAGLAAATCAGLWIGFAPPPAVEAYWTGEGAFSALDPVSGYDFAMLGG